MKRVKLISHKIGISEKTGKGYCHLLVAFDRTDGERVTREFWVQPENVKDVVLVNDAEYYISAEYDDYLRDTLGTIRPVKSAD